MYDVLPNQRVMRLEGGVAVINGSPVTKNLPLTDKFAYNYSFFGHMDDTSTKAANN